MVNIIKRTLAGALISGFGAVATLWIAALAPDVAPAQADSRCDPVCHGTWCPGDPINYQVKDLAVGWDPNVCHEFHQVAGQPGVYAEGPLPPGTFVCPPFAFMCP
ncbi:hypothetical protein TUM20985_25600 [Mycobacterium antarcticum]|uniref:hypothetical protein n=1 Tax=unclassified Mycolicibacterium TaxID=2636767 RepID=UPI0023A190BD|nr:MULTISPECIES: hypothetical protein [unclassified Mycolicibacterium]BDX32013.1 hypothetical protein TUM20985_25600 [Mycolicibacterium sp. TUM20985]GLP75317.1 hypothetical protein TUM20983_24270 [Mycolicibacterium sp. TUM20983]GLP84419.1 hypothetical protein TUM20984_58390 [Mycolicibacterium sp. TUM20984]